MKRVMADPTVPSSAPKEAKWLTDLVNAEPRTPLVVPFMAYLLLMGLFDLAPATLQPLSMFLHIVLIGYVTWLFRKHLPPWGKVHLGPALIVGLLAALLWVAGQKLLDGIEVMGCSLGGRLSLSWSFPFVLLEAPEVQDPHVAFGSGVLFGSHVVLKILRAVTIVAVVEELFWRGFILRAFVSWDRYDQVPWGKFGWTAFLGSSLLSVAQHPGNWGVSIVCWMLFNALFYWKKSLSCLMVAHAATNLTLYLYVVWTGDWRLW